MGAGLAVQMDIETTALMEMPMVDLGTIANEMLESIRVDASETWRSGQPYEERQAARSQLWCIGEYERYMREDKPVFAESIAIDAGFPIQLEIYARRSYYELVKKRKRRD